MGGGASKKKGAAEQQRVRRNPSHAKPVARTRRAAQPRVRQLIVCALACGVQLEDARASLLAGRIESAVEMLESLRAKLLVPGKSQQPRKGFEGLLTELDALRGSMPTLVHLGRVLAIFCPSFSPELAPCLTGTP
jgi:hypothetical protein